jgi:hypothetical protein
MKPALKHFLKRFISDKRGSIILIGALTLSVLIGTGGAAYDFGIQQMAYKNGQFAADLAATSGSAAKLHEHLDTLGGFAEQEDRVRMYYRLNSRGFNADPSFSPNISIVETSEAFITRITGNSKIPTNFLGVLGVDTLNYSIETETNLRNPGNPLTYDMVLVLDYTNSMQDNEIQAGISRLQALQQASTFLINSVMCGDETGENCDDNDNRASIIPYALGPIGLDECDLLNPPEYCACIPPRDAGPDWTPPENPCVPLCQRTGAADPNSENFNCTCVPFEDRPRPNDLVKAAKDFLDLVDESEPTHGYAKRCLPSCLDGGCCPAKCIPDAPLNTPGVCREVPGTEACARCIVQNYNRAFRGPGRNNVPCCPDISLKTGTPNELNWGYLLGPTPPQTVQCHRALCTASCTFGGGGQDPCIEDPEICVDPCDMPNPPPSCNVPDPRPGFPDLGQNHIAPKTFFAKTQQGALPMFSAIYNPALHAKNIAGFSDPKAILAQTQGDGIWAVTLENCLDAGQLDCQSLLSEAVNNDFTEGNTNSAAGFQALLDADSYLPFMRPNANDDTQAVRVVVWVTDGLNNRYLFKPRPGENVPIVIPQSELIDGKWQRVPEDLDDIVKNHYDSNGRFLEDATNPAGKTAQGWSDHFTRNNCTRLRNYRVSGEPRPIIIYTVAVGDVGNLSTDEGKATARLMNECAYGPVGASNETDTPPIDPATGQALQQRFFAVQNVQELNVAFRTIAGTIGRIRITD